MHTDKPDLLYGSQGQACGLELSDLRSSKNSAALHYRQAPGQPRWTLLGRVPKIKTFPDPLTDEDIGDVIGVANLDAAESSLLFLHPSFFLSQTSCVLFV